MTAWAAGAEWKSCVRCKQYVASINSSLIVCRECWGKGRKRCAECLCFYLSWFVRCWVPFACLARPQADRVEPLVPAWLSAYFSCTSAAVRLSREGDGVIVTMTPLGTRTSGLELTCLFCARSFDSLSLATFGVTRSLAWKRVLHSERTPGRVLSLASCVLLFLLAASPGVSGSWSG